MKELSEQKTYDIDWERVKRIRVHLLEWMSTNNYEEVDIERAIAYRKAPGHIRPSEEKTQ